MSAVIEKAVRQMKKAEEQARREALELHMLRDIRALKLDVGMARQFRFHEDRKWAFDFAWPRRKFALEVEGGVHSGGRHVRGAGYTADCEKYAEALLLGWRVLRATGEQVKNGTAAGWLERALMPKAMSVVLAGLGESETGELAHAKERPVRSPTYLRAVASLPCIHCGRVGASQAAHINRGKGMAMKAPDNHTFPLCTFTTGASMDQGVPSCHYRYDNYQLGDKHWAAEQGEKWAEQTYSTLKRAGKVPMNVPPPRFR